MLHEKNDGFWVRNLLFQGAISGFFPNICDIIPQTKSPTRLPTQVNPPVLGEGRISDVASKVLLPGPFKPECRGENELYFEMQSKNLLNTGEHGFFAILLMVQKSSDHQLRLVVYLILYRVLYIPGWCINSTIGENDILSETLGVERPIFQVTGPVPLQVILKIEQQQQKALPSRSLNTSPVKSYFPIGKGSSSFPTISQG